MKRHFEIIIYCMMPFIVSYAFWYVIGAGISASWDTATWSGDLKYLLSTWAMLFGFALYHRIEKEFK